MASQMDPIAACRRCAFLKALASAVVVVSMVGCNAAQRTDSEGWLKKRLERGSISHEQSVARARELSKKIEQAYETCQHLSMAVEMHEPDLDLLEWVERSMTPDRLKSNIYIGGKKVLVYTIVGNEYQEWVAGRGDVPAKHVMHRLESHDASKPITLLDGIEAYGCAFGFYTNNLLGPISHKREFLADRSANGYFVGQEIVDGRNCDVVACLPNERFWIMEMFYVRPDGFLARRESWEFIDGTKRHLIRVFDFQRLENKPLPESTWRFETAPPPLEKMKEIK